MYQKTLIILTLSLFFGCSESVPPKAGEGTDDSFSYSDSLSNSESFSSDSFTIETGQTDSETYSESGSYSLGTDSTSEFPTSTSGGTTSESDSSTQQETLTENTETIDSDTEPPCDIFTRVCSADQTQLLYCNKETLKLEVLETCEETELCLPYDGNGPKCQCNPNYKTFYCGNNNGTVNAEDGCGNKSLVQYCYNNSCKDSYCTEEEPIDTTSDSEPIDTDTWTDDAGCGNEIARCVPNYSDPTTTYYQNCWDLGTPQEVCEWSGECRGHCFNADPCHLDCDPY